MPENEMPGSGLDALSYGQQDETQQQQTIGSSDPSEVVDSIVNLPDPGISEVAGDAAVEVAGEVAVEVGGVIVDILGGIFS